MNNPQPIFTITGEMATIFIFQHPHKKSIGLTQVLHYNNYLAHYTLETELDKATERLQPLISDLVKHIYLHDPMNADRYLPWMDETRVPLELKKEWAILIEQFKKELATFEGQKI